MNLKQQIKEKEAELLKLKKQLDSINSTEQIKTFEDACKDQGINPEDPKFKYEESTDEEVDNSGPAFEQLKVIRNALLGNVKLEWGSNEPYKYFPYFDLSSPKGSGFCHSPCISWFTFSCVSARLAMDSKEKALYFGSQFEDIWYEYMVEHKKG